MENAPSSTEIGPTFSYEGTPVGSFEDGIAPTVPGLYRYLAFRSIGHYLMGVALNAGGRPVCSYVQDGVVISFEVIGYTTAPLALQLDGFKHSAAE